MLGSRTCFDYAKIIDLDNKLYPTANTVSINNIQQWFSSMPDLCFMLTHESEDVGICVWIPLNKSGWSKMVKGELFEHTLQDEHLFNPRVDSELFLHLYHIEKFSSQSPPIWHDALIHTNNRIKSLNLDIEVQGISAYCTTAAGIYLTTKKWNLYELGYKSNEYIISLTNATFSKSLSDEELQNYKDKQALLLRCMFVGSTKEHKESIVWKIFN